MISKKYTLTLLPFILSLLIGCGGFETAKQSSVDELTAQYKTSLVDAGMSENNASYIARQSSSSLSLSSTSIAASLLKGSFLAISSSDHFATDADKIAALKIIGQAYILAVSAIAANDDEVLELITFANEYAAAYWDDTGLTGVNLTDGITQYSEGFGDGLADTDRTTTYEDLPRYFTESAVKGLLSNPSLNGSTSEIITALTEGLITSISTSGNTDIAGVGQGLIVRNLILGVRNAITEEGSTSLADANTLLTDINTIGVDNLNANCPSETSTLTDAASDLVPTLGSWSGSKRYGVALSHSTTNSMAHDSFNNIYLAGDTKAGLDGNTQVGIWDMFVSKLNSAGDKIWTVQLGAVGADSYARAIAIDSKNNIYVSGSTNGNFNGTTLLGTQSIFLVKLNPFGQVLWTKMFGASTVYSEAISLAIDANDSLYIAGYTDGSLYGQTLNGTGDALILKLNTSGELDWARQYGASNADNYATEIAFDQEGKVYVSGATKGDFDGHTLTGTEDFFLIKMNTTGTKLWSTQLGAESEMTEAFRVACDSSNNVYVTGFTHGDLDGNTLEGIGANYFLVKYTSAGTKLWSQQHNGEGNSARAETIQIDASDNIYIIGTTDDGVAVNGIDGNLQIGYRDLFITKLDTDGNRTWTKELGAANETTTPWASTLDSAGNIFISGYVTGSGGGTFDGLAAIGLGDIFVTKYNADGVKQ